MMNKNLKREITALVQHVDHLHREIATVVKGRDDDNSAFEYMSSQLDEIVKATEQASNVIMDASENILDVSSKLSSRLSDSELKNLKDKISAGAAETIEACSFQDIAGQRAGKILGSLKFMEGRVSSMIQLCGLGAMAAQNDVSAQAEVADDGIEIGGPALSGKGLSQAEIDAILN